MKSAAVKSKKGSVFLSVIIPAYNMSHCIGKCIDSILKQKMKDIEILIVDDASKDDLKETLEPYIVEGAPIIPIYLTENGGVSNARNVGVRAAKGEYIHFVDADDVIVAGAYKHMVKRVAESYCDIVVANYIFHSSEIRDEVRYYASEGLARCLESNNLSLCNKWFKRSFLLEKKLALDTGMKTAEDAMFCFQAYRQHPSVCCVNELLYCYEYDDQDSERHRERDLHIDSFLNSLKVLEENFELPVPEETEDIWAKAFLNYSTFLYNGIWSKMQAPKMKEDAFHRMQQVFQKISQSNEAFHLGYGKQAVAFEALTGCDYMTFVTIDYQQYVMIRLLQKNIGGAAPAMPGGSISQLFVEECRQGHVGMKMILKAIKNWLIFKIAK